MRHAQEGLSSVPAGILQLHIGSPRDGNARETLGGERARERERETRRDFERIGGFTLRHYVGIVLSKETGHLLLQNHQTTSICESNHSGLSGLTWS